MVVGISLHYIGPVGEFFNTGTPLPYKVQPLRPVLFQFPVGHGRNDHDKTWLSVFLAGVADPHFLALLDTGD